jgi:hypothetical protein
VTAIGVMGNRTRHVIDATALQTPAFRRVALLARSAPGDASALVRRAVAAGIGLAFVGNPAIETAVPAPRALLGVPGVFRWWIAELAYRSWSYDRSHPVS